MKKLLLIAVTIIFSMGQVFAAPVDVNSAKNVGVKFVKTNVAAAKDVQDAELAYTLYGDNGVACLYIFNYGEKGFFIVSADDRAKPILAYSDESRFDLEHMPEAMGYYLNHFKTQIEYAVENDLYDEEIAAEWDLVRKEGLVTRNRLDRSVSPLINLSWNQDWPYNYYCPTAGGGPGGRCYVGCVADAMAMVFKYWNWPDQGVGTHTYTPQGYPTQTVDFSATTYDWNNMPVSLSSGSPQAQIQAVATLMYHCGVSVNMQYSPQGSGAYSTDVPNAIAEHFKYTEHNELRDRDLYSKTQWEDMLIELFDEGFPAYYSGSGNGGGHAFVCDGYDNNRMFHFNWGWSGWCNSYYAIDALNTMNGNFNDNQSACFDMIPDYIYDALIPAVTDLHVTTVNANSKTGLVTWTNPSANMAGETITNIEKLVLLRNGQEVYAENNVTPGAVMTFEDNVSDYDCYEYKLYYLSNGVKGRTASTRFQYGPTCTWKVVCTTTAFQGWNGGKVQVLNAFGSVIDEVTMTSSTPVSQQVAMPEGNVSFKWVAPASVVSNLSINIKDSSNTSVYNYSGASSGLNGVLYSGDNDCAGCLPPDNLSGTYEYEDGVFGTLLTWEYADEPKNFKIYRSSDNVTYEEVGEADKTQHEYFDEVEAGTYYYKVTAYRNHCESTPAWAPDGNDYILVEVTSVCEEDNELKLYPNPVNGLLNVEVAGMEEIVVCNVLGQIVATIRCDADQIQLNAAAFEAGIYTVKVKSANGTFSKRITVVH